MKKIIMGIFFQAALIFNTNLYAGNWFCLANGPDNACGMGYGYETKSEALNRALSECSQDSRAKGSKCKINYCTINPPAHACGFNLKTGKLDPTWFCLARGPNDLCGYGINYPNKEEAKDRALKECQYSGSTCHIDYCTTKPPDKACGQSTK